MSTMQTSASSSDKNKAWDGDHSVIVQKQGWLLCAKGPGMEFNEKRRGMESLFFAAI